MNFLQTTITSTVGLSISILMPVMLFISIYKNKRFRFNENTISYLCNYHTTKELFKTYTLVIAALMTGFFLLLIKKFFFFEESIITTLAIICTFSLALVPFTSSDFKRKAKRRKLHNVIATIFFISLFILIIIFQIEVYKRTFLAGLIGFLLPLFMLSSGIISISKNKTITGAWETTYLILFSVWSLITAMLVIFI